MDDLFLMLMILLSLLALTIVVTWCFYSVPNDGEAVSLNSYVDFMERVHTTASERNCNVDIPVYYINLERSADRRRWMESQIKRFHITQAERVVRVEGRADPTISYVCTFTNLSSSEIGCTLSHLRAIKQAYDRNLSEVLIVEDDASFLLSPYWDRPLSQYIAQAPPDWGVLKLFWDMPEQDEYTRKGCSELSDSSERYSLSHRSDYTVAYIINRSAMERVLQCAFRQGRFHLDQTQAEAGAADWYLFQLKGAPIRLYHLYPPLIFPNNCVLASTIHDEHTHIHIHHGLQAITPYIDRVVQEEISRITPDHIPTLMQSRIRMYCVEEPTQTDIVLWYRGGEVHWLTRILDKLDPQTYRLFVYHPGSAALTLPKDYIHQHITLHEMGGAYGSFAYHVWRFIKLPCSDHTIFLSSLQPVTLDVIQGRESYEMELDSGTFDVPTPSCLNTRAKWYRMIFDKPLPEGEHRSTITRVSRSALQQQSRELWTRLILTLGYGRNIETIHYTAHMWSHLLS